MAIVVDSGNEQLVKSTERVRDVGEVFTASATVQEMLDLLPPTIWAPHPSASFLEPACGDGNFLVAILKRKLGRIARDYSIGKLPAGLEVGAAQFHGLQALASIYAVDISVDNVVGGTAGHEVGARARLLDIFSAWNVEALGKRLTSRSAVLRAAEWIVEHNVIVGNMLPFEAQGKPTGRDALPIIEYSWEPSNQAVTLRKTTLGDVIATEAAKTTKTLSLFEPAEPIRIWGGKAINLHEVVKVEAPALRGPARNGIGRRNR